MTCVDVTPGPLLAFDHFARNVFCLWCWLLLTDTPAISLRNEDELSQCQHWKSTEHSLLGAAPPSLSLPVLASRRRQERIRREAARSIGEARGSPARWNVVGAHSGGVTVSKWFGR